MIRLDEDALVCDLAETYHIFNYRALSPRTVAVLSVGLRDDARIKRKMTGRQYTTEQLFLAQIIDRLSMLVWFQTEDGHKNQNRPQSFVDIILGRVEDTTKKYNTYKSSADFETARNQLLHKTSEV